MSGKDVSKIKLAKNSSLEKNSFSHEDFIAGIAPNLRGPYSTMYVRRPWTIRQYAGFSTANETNQRFKLLLESGQTGLSVAFDLPTQLGMDSDDEDSLGEVGKVGVPIDSLEDMETLFADINLGEVSTSNFFQ